MKCAILLTAYGISSPQTESALRLFDAETRKRFPEMPVRWAFTSCRVRERMAAAKKKSDSIQKALQKLGFEKFSHVALQPLQIIPGQEHAGVGLAVEEITEQHGLTISTGRPLLTTEKDMQAAALAVLRHLPGERTPDEDVVLMGHGTRHPSMRCYEALASAVHAQDPRIHIGAMTGGATLKTILPRLKSKKVWLMPLLSLVGPHTLFDMAGDNSTSWKLRINNAGHNCIPILKGLAEYQGFINIWLDHLTLAVNLLTRHEPGSGKI